MIEKSSLAPPFDCAQGMLCQRGEFVFVLLFALSYLFGATQSADAQSLKKVRIASKGGGETLLPYPIPQRLGFYKEEGLDVDVIVTRGTVTTQVVVSGAVDYSNGGSIPAMLGGARLKILLISTDKPAQYLVTQPKFLRRHNLPARPSLFPIRRAIRRLFFASCWPRTECLLKVCR